MDAAASHGHHGIGYIEPALRADVMANPESIDHLCNILDGGDRCGGVGASECTPGAFLVSRKAVRMHRHARSSRTRL